MVTLDILSTLGDIELIARTSSTLRVQNVMQLSLAPAFLLAGIGAIMNVMTNRLIWVANRIDRILAADEEGKAGEAMLADIPALEQRRIFAQRAVMMSTAAALAIAIVIVLLFISAFVYISLGTIVAAVWMLAMAFLIAGLAFFVMEARTAAKRNRDRMKQRGDLN